LTTTTTTSLLREETAFDDERNDGEIAAAADADARGEALETSADYDTFRVAELKEMLRARALATSGRQAELIARLKSADDGDTTAAT